MISLITGGARSGKSRFAESILEDKKDVVYIATSKVYDEEMKERVELHKESRPAIWRTYEGTYNLEGALGEERYYLLDCVTVLTSNIMFDISKDVEYIDYEMQADIENKVMDELEALIEAIRKKGLDLILVTNEIGSGLVPEHHISRVFRDVQGRINQRLGKIADEVHLVACGIPVKIK